MKPKIFVGSSREKLNVAYAIQHNLDHHAYVTVWDQMSRSASTESFLHCLMNELKDYHFGVFVLTPEDKLEIRGNTTLSARDNVIFELGLFIGHLGKEKNFVIVPRAQKDFHIPTDLAGIVPLDYEANRPDRNLRAALGSACDDIRFAIEKWQKEPELIQHKILSSPLDLVRNGVAEVLGEIMLLRTTARPNIPQDTIAGTIRVRFHGVTITNAFHGCQKIDLKTGTIATFAGIAIKFSAQYLQSGNSNQLSATVSNTSVGGALDIYVPSGIRMRDEEARIIITGIRANVTGRVIGTVINASVESQPSHAHAFINGDRVQVGIVNDGLRVEVIPTTSTIQGRIQKSTIKLTEGFPRLFVQHVGRTLNPRVSFEANSNTQIHIVVSGLPSGVGLTWPSDVPASEGTGMLRRQYASSTDVIYEFTTPDQGQSDLTFEVFEVSPEVEIGSDVSPGEATVFAQVQLYPGSSSNRVPRFDDPLTEAKPFLWVTK